MQRNYSQLKEQEKTPEKINNETEISNLSDKEFKILVIKMQTEWRKKINLNKNDFNKELENIKNTISK